MVDFDARKIPWPRSADILREARLCNSLTFGCTPILRARRDRWDAAWFDNFGYAIAVLTTRELSRIGAIHHEGSVSSMVSGTYFSFWNWRMWWPISNYSSPTISSVKWKILWMQYFGGFTDDATRMAFLYLLTMKTAAEPWAIYQVQKWIRKGWKEDQGIA